MGLANLHGLNSSSGLLSLTRKSPEHETPHGGAFGTPSFFLEARLSSQSWGCSAQSSSSLHSVPLTCTSWMVTTAIMNRYDGMGAPPPQDFCSVQSIIVSTVASQCVSPWSPVCPLGPLLWRSLQNPGPAVPSPLGPW